MIDLSRNTLVRRYTRTDLNGGAAGPGLTQAEIKRQNQLCGFRYGDPSHPIRVEGDADSVYFKQGEGPNKVAEPKITDPVPTGNTPYSHSY